MYQQAIDVSSDQYLYLLTEGKNLYRSNLADLYCEENKYSDAQLILTQILTSLDPKKIHTIGDLNPRDDSHAKLLQQFADLYWEQGPDKEIEAAKIQVVLEYPTESYNKLRPQTTAPFQHDWAMATDNTDPDYHLEFSLDLKSHGPGKFDAAVHAGRPRDVNQEGDLLATGTFKGAIGQIKWTATVDSGVENEPKQEHANTATVIRVGHYLVWKITELDESMCPDVAVLTEQPAGAYH
jgi:hypothetical protein